MPSHKHKKKKKSHKRPKKYSSSSSEDDDNSPWKVALSDADSDDSKNQERLTPLVRQTYMKYLKQALSQNLEEWFESSNEPRSESVEEMVNKWSSLLEQKALRTCLVSELYRTSMVSLIRQIKTSTNDKTLYIEEKKPSRLKEKLPLNQGSQTESSEVGDMETQTDFPFSSVLELPLPKSSPSSRPYDPAIDFSNSNSSDGGVSSSHASRFHQVVSGNSANQEVCNITSTSDLYDPAELSSQEDRVKTDAIENTLKQPFQTDSGCLGKPRSSIENCNAEIQVTNNFSNCRENTHTTDEISLTSEKLISVKKRQLSITSTSSKNNLDERLSALGLFGDNTEDGFSQPMEKSKKSNWFAEEVAQSCNLTRILMRMTTRQREKVLKQIKDLFGEENGPLTELSEENVSLCRKRIAQVVVMELTPIYQARRIASRHLFKFLAKKITKSIMEKSYAPDTRSIRWRVKKFFEDGKVIMSESDCM